MEWTINDGEEKGSDGLTVGAKVMTDQQMEMLRKQISVYATICDRLVQMHRSLSAQQDFPGIRLGNPYYDPLLSAAVHRIPSRQRWTPKPAQLQTLEHIFEQCNATPSRQRIKKITNDLAQHGQISESNVYNWFQNRRARSKRKQPALVPNNGDSEVETEPESAKESMTKPEDNQPDESSAFITDHMYCQSPELGLELDSPGSYDLCWLAEQSDLFDCYQR